MVAAGGRYDSLLRACWPTPSAHAAAAAGGGTLALAEAHGVHGAAGSPPPPGAVGATLNIEKLVDVMGMLQAVSVLCAVVEPEAVVTQRIEKLVDVVGMLQAVSMLHATVPLNSVRGCAEK
eukprot:1141202-Pelagomonas_calceolata.AAC.2